MLIPITQSEEWHTLQDALHEKSIFKRDKDFQYLAIIKSTPVGNYLYCPNGPVAKDDDSFKNAIKDLKEEATKNSALFIRVEPYDEEQKKLLPTEAKKSKDLNPKETWLLDLTGKDEDLDAKLPSRLKRYYKASAKNGITITESHNPEDIDHLLKLQQALAKEKGISTFSKEYLKTELAQPFATLYLVHHEKEVIAAGLVFDDKTTRYNLQGAQSDQGRKLHATGILTIQLIKDAKKQGLKTFDFWGIAPEGAPENHPWAGFTNFKKTFAGYQKNHAGTYDIVINPAKYRLYQLTRKANQIIRRLK